MESSWGKGADRAIAMGEGKPEQWASLGLRQIPDPWRKSLGDVFENTIAMFGNQLPKDIRRVIGGACIHRSCGILRKLPVSFLWEVLTIAMVAKMLNVEGVILIPLAEEVHRCPQQRDKFLYLGQELSDVVPRLGKDLGVSLTSYWHPVCCNLKKVDRADLYGLFAPFADSFRLRTYPFGDPEEKRILDTYESYCGRYQHPPKGLQGSDLIVEGIHVSKSVLLGIDSQASYLATVPLPSLHNQNQVMVDSIVVPTIEKLIEYPEPWWPNDLLKKVLKHDIESVRLTIGRICSKKYGE